MSNFIEFITHEQKYLMQRPLKASMAKFEWFFHSNVTGLVQANLIGTNTANHVYHVCSSSIINRGGLVQLSVVFRFPGFARASTFPSSMPTLWICLPLVLHFVFHNLHFFTEILSNLSASFQVSPILWMTKTNC